MVALNIARMKPFANILLIGLAVGAAGCAETPPAGAPPFAHLAVAAGGIETTHRLGFRIEADGPFVLAGPKHRTDVFNGVPYEISLAAFIEPRRAVVVHAERVKDMSGASDYSDRPMADWPLEGFVSEGPACLPLSPADIEGEHDLEWLAANGFEPDGAFGYQQYFTTTPDHNDEVVVTLIAEAATCNAPGAAENALAALRAATRVRPLKQGSAGGASFHLQR